MSRGLLGFPGGRSSGWALLPLALPVCPGETGGMSLNRRVPALQRGHGLVLGAWATKVLLEPGLCVPRLCSGTADVQKRLCISRSVCVRTEKGIQDCLEEEKVVWVQTSRQKDIYCCCLNMV